MEKEKITYSENNLYAENIRQFNNMFRLSFISKKNECKAALNWEVNWYYDFIPYQNDEEVRLCAVLPMMKFEIEQGILSDDMVDEIEGYYNAVIIENTFDTILKDDEEREMVKKDLQWCYDIAKQKGLID